MNRVALDAMGGDRAPEVILEGVRRFRQEDSETEILLTGPSGPLESAAKELNCTLVQASQIVEMDETPSAVVKSKRDSSVAKAIDLVKNGEADAMVTMGNSGAAIAFALFQLGRLPGVSRPGLMTSMPNPNGRSQVVDLGAMVDCKPEHLLHYAVLASVYVEEVTGIDNPRIGLLSIGEEKSKGNELTAATYAYLEKSGLNFIGNVEGNDICRGTADVIVCDGFVGNVILKFGEGLVEFVFSSMRGALKRILEKTHESKESGMQKWALVKEIIADFDYEEIGCAELLGVKGLCFVGHGRSEPRAVANAIKTARQAAAHKEVIQHQQEALKEALARIA